MSTIEKTKSNKPFFLDSKYFISISHKDNLQISAKSTDPLGLDIEIFNSKVTDWAVFKDRFFNELDQKIFKNMTQNYNLNPNLAWLILFSAKEAYLKLTDLKRDPLNFYFEVIYHDENHLKFKVHDLLTIAYVDVFWNFKHLPILNKISFYFDSKSKYLPDILSISTF